MPIVARLCLCFMFINLWACRIFPSFSRSSRFSGLSAENLNCGSLIIEISYVTALLFDITIVTIHFIVFIFML